MPVVSRVTRACRYDTQTAEFRGFGDRMLDSLPARRGVGGQVSDDLFVSMESVHRSREHEGSRTELARTADQTVADHRQGEGAAEQSAMRAMQ